MAYPWHIRTFTPAEKELRRSALDFYGILGVFATLVVVTLAVCWLGNVYRYNFFSPIAFSDRRRTLYGQLARTVYLSDWYLNRRLSLRCWRWRVPLGTRKTWLLGTMWISFLVFMCTAGTTDDYFHLTKRLAHTAASFLPAQYLLSSRFILQQTSIVSYQTHETLNKAHRWLGRTIYTLLVLHGSLYINYFIRAELYERLFYWDVALGATGISIMTAIVITSLPYYRRKIYKFFFSVHQLLSILILPVAWFHVLYVRRYVLIAGTIYVIELVGRSLLTREVKKMKITQVSSTALDLRGIAGWVVASDVEETKIRIPAGSHFYVSVPSMPGSSRGNPFTCCSADEEDGEIRFFVRVRDGFTKELKDVAESNSNSETSLGMLIEGPYGIAEAFPGFGCFDSFLFVTGGIGITMTFAVLRELVLRIEEESLPLEKARIKFVWAVGGTEDAAWPLAELLKAGPTSCTPDVDIFISDGSRQEEEGREDMEGRASMELDDLVAEDSQRQSLLPTSELPEPRRSTTTVLPAATDDSNNKRDETLDAAIESLRYRYARTQITPTIRIGRPDLRRITDDFCRGAVGKRIAVFICGPEGMGGDVRRALERHHRDSTVWIWEEKFGM
ncbi:hypothetical protein ABW20_dc0100482 [Dactylellina cionopaga]|nr:hypothetical protein ABW20_dc0100482 [Dactylellina cionopaga]